MNDLRLGHTSIEVMRSAKFYAETTKSNYVDVEHLLIGLVASHDTVMLRVWRHFHIRTDNVTYALRSLGAVRRRGASHVDSTPSSRLEQICRHAEDLAHEARFLEVEPSHLLTALLTSAGDSANQDNLACTVLTLLGVKPSDVLDKLGDEFERLIEQQSLRQPDGSVAPHAPVLATEFTD